MCVPIFLEQETEKEKFGTWAPGVSGFLGATSQLAPLQARSPGKVWGLALTVLVTRPARPPR